MGAATESNAQSGLSEQIIRASQDGSLEAQRELYECYKAKVYSLAVYLTGDAEMAKDLAAVRLYSLGGLRALQFKYRSEQSALCVFQLPSGSKLSFGEQPSEQYQADGVYCWRARSRNCVLYCFTLGETQCALMTRQTDPAVVDALIQAFKAEAGLSQTSPVTGQPDKKPQSPQQAAEFNLPDLDRRQISTTDLKGSVVVLDFWATWCGPCLAEVPTFNRLQAKYAGRGVKVIGIAVQSGWAADIEPYRDGHRVGYPIIIGDDEVVEKYGVIGFPTTYILDKGLRVHRKFTGKLPEIKERCQTRSGNARTVSDPESGRVRRWCGLCGGSAALSELASATRLRLSPDDCFIWSQHQRQLSGGRTVAGQRQIRERESCPR